VFRPGTKVNPYTGGSMKDFADFTGPVSAKALITAVTETLDASHLTQLATSAQHEALMQQDPQLSKVLLFSDKPASTTLAKGLSWAYARRLLFAEVRPSSEDGKALAAQYGVDTYPKILVVKVSPCCAVLCGPHSVLCCARPHALLFAAGLGDSSRHLMSQEPLTHPTFRLGCWLLAAKAYSGSRKAPQAAVATPLSHLSSFCHKADLTLAPG
jgi:hypothetical protein